MEDTFLDVFKTAALQAGAVARRLQGQVPLRNKRGHTPESAALTAVDLATQDVILLALRRMLPDVAVDAEEDTATVSLFAPADGRPLVVIDPVDGTLNYSRGAREYAVMGSLVRDGRHTAAVVYFPQWGELYWAARGKGAWLEREASETSGRPETRPLEPASEVGPLGLSAAQPIRLADGAAPHRQAAVDGRRRVVLVSPGTPGAVRADLERDGFEVQVSRCSAVDSCAPATGRAVGALTTKPSDRRRALGFLVTLEAGGTVRCGGRDWRGEDAPEGLGPPCITADSAELAGQLERIASRRA